MNPADFEAWIARMGWSARRCARELGCSQNSIAAWRRGQPEAAPYIALACAALTHGLPGWRRSECHVPEIQEHGDENHSNLMR